MLSQNRSLKEMCRSDYGIRALTKNEETLQNKYLKKHKCKFITTKERKDIKVSNKFEKVVL